MEKITVTNTDGSTEDFFPQSYTDAAVAAAKTVVEPTDTEVDIQVSDGTVKKFIPAPTA
jgi:hypothetical protein